MPCGKNTLHSLPLGQGTHVFETVLVEDKRRDCWTTERSWFDHVPCMYQLKTGQWDWILWYHVCDYVNDHGLVMVHHHIHNFKDGQETRQWIVVVFQNL